MLLFAKKELPKMSDFSSEFKKIFDSFPNKGRFSFCVICVLGSASPDDCESDHALRSKKSSSELAPCALASDSNSNNEYPRLRASIT